jgi:hypothetical protein
MKSELARNLKREFHKRMIAGLPNCQKVATAFGGYVYRDQDKGSGRYVFIFLSPDLKYDRFTIELAASARPDFPFDILPGEDSPTGAVRRRIRGFLEEKSDGWWRLNESDQLLDLKAFMSLNNKAKIDEAAATIPLLVDDAFRELKSALPKFLATLRFEERQN